MCPQSVMPSHIDGLVHDLNSADHGYRQMTSNQSQTTVYNCTWGPISYFFSFTRVSLAAWVKEALLQNRKPILDLILDWRCLIWVWKESLQSNQTTYIEVFDMQSCFTCLNPRTASHDVVSVILRRTIWRGSMWWPSQRRRTLVKAIISISLPNFSTEQGRH